MRAAHQNIREFIGLHDLTIEGFFKAVLSEFLGTFILIVAGCGSVVTLEPKGSPANICPAATFGMTVAMIVWTFGHLSGAHINPTVSLSFMVTGHLSLARCVAYSISQCCGALAGSAVLWHMVPPSWRQTIGSTVFAEDVTLWQGFLVEVMSTFFLLLAVFSTSDRLRTDHGGSEPLTIGLVVFVQSAWAGSLTGCSMNPARTLGPALVSGTWDHHWVYWVAPNVGGVCGALLYQHLLAEKPQDAAAKLNVDLEDKEINTTKT